MAFHSLNIGTNALLTARYGLDITGQNLSNVNTEGYARQRANQSGMKGYTAGNLVIGTGSWVNTVNRIANENVEKQLRQAITQDEYYGNLQDGYSNLQSVFAELTYFNEKGGNALGDSMNRFWTAMNEFSGNVQSLSIRSTAMEEATALVSRFNKLGTQMEDLRVGVNDQVVDSVNQINRIMKEIADLNSSIVTTELGGNSNVSANDLRDLRGECLKELYEYMDVDVVEESNGSVIVSLHGRNLVYYDQTKPIEIDRTIGPDGKQVNTPVFGSDKYPLEPKSGQLAAQLELRDKIIPSYQKDIDTLAQNFIWEFNRAHSQTIGLESFDKLTAQNGPLDASVPLNQLSYDGFTPAEGGAFQIVNGNLEILLYNKASGEAITVNVEIDADGRNRPDGEPDMILWDPDNPDASNSLINRIQKAIEEKLPGTFNVSIDGQNRMSIQSMSSGYGFAFGSDTSGVLAALGMNVMFTGHDSITMGVNQSLKENPGLIGGGKSFKSGDNSGIESIIDVQDKAIPALGGMTLEDFYQSVAGRLGSEASANTVQKNLSCDVMQRMFVQRENLSGVSEDEEVTKMITYQRAFQSAAKFISTVDQLYETLLNM